MSEKTNKNILVISSKLPVITERGEGFVEVLNELVKENRVDILYSHSIIMQDNLINSYRKTGFRIFNLRNSAERCSIDEKIKRILRDTEYNIIIFPNKYDFKYYYLYVVEYAAKAITLLFSGKEYFLQKMKREKRAVPEQDMKYIDKIAIINYADFFIADTEFEKKIFERYAQKTEFRLMKSSDVNSLLDSICLKKRYVLKDKFEVAVLNEQNGFNFIKITKFLMVNKIRVNHYGDKKKSINAYNEALTRSSKEFVLIAESDITISDLGLYSMLKCIKSNPYIAITEPGEIYDSEYEEDGQIPYNIKDYFRSSMGNWSESRNTDLKCMLINKNIIDKIGGFDEDYKTISASKIDLYCRLIQKGYKIIRCGEVLCYGKGGEGTSDKNEFDRDLIKLKKRWGEEIKNF